MKITKPASHQTAHASHPATHGDTTGHVPEDEHVFVPPLKPGDPGPVTLKKIKPPYVGIFLPGEKRRYRYCLLEIRLQTRVSVM